MASNERRFRYFVAGFIGLATVIGLWEASVVSGIIPALALPRPSRVFAEFPSHAISHAFLRNWSITLTIWIASLTIGLVFGLVLGFAAGASSSLSQFLIPTLSYFRSIPPIALFPIALIATGPGRLPVLLITACAAALTVFPGTMDAARVVADRYRSLAQIVGSSRIQFLFYFVAPGAAVYALASSRVAATTAFIVCVAGEMIIGGRTGVGAAILDATERYRLEEAYSYVLATGVVGLTIDLAFAQTRRLRWLRGV